VAASDPEPTRFAVLLAYDGGAYHGWQFQPDRPTVQGAVAGALAHLVGAPVRVTGASRTDAGVHALGQVATFDSPRPFRPAVVRAALNATLPRDVRVLAATVAPADLDARRSACLKRYGYLIDCGVAPWPFLRGHAWHVDGRLDVDAVRAALGEVRGRHDFGAFCASAGRDRDPTCTVRSVRVARRGALLGLFVSADAFLHHMVRNVVGTVVEVGLGRRPAAWIREVLEGRDRREAGPTAPPHGLHLLSVRYATPLFAGGGRPRRAR
jgi:tRNA pseudouridine38-40 synthase